MASKLRRMWIASGIAALACGSPAGDRAGRHAPSTESSPITGFAAAGAAQEHALERSLVSGISADQLGAFHRELTAEPHRATSARNTALAGWIADAWRAQGWDEVALRTYEAYFTEPADIALEMIAPVTYRAALREDGYAVDPQSRRTGLPGAYTAFSASGDVTADVVYARGGDPEDYEVLRRHGISVAGKIVVARYAQPYSFRGFKVMTAEHEGAAAIVLYSDPAEDGAARGPTFPDGPWGPESHVQRGLAGYASIVPGDVTTPGWPSLPGARRLALDQAATLPRIPVLAISARDARPLLANMTGEQVPAAWAGGLPITYRFAGGVRAHLRVQMTGALRRYVNVEARIRGSEHPEQWVVLGNHRDAWVYGGADPGSGTAAMLELTRGLGALHRAGWRPKRTLVVCSWDGEEEGLVGSTEWAEQYAAELERGLVAYLNVDTAIFGVRSLLTGADDPNFEAAAVPSLEGMIVEASRELPAPNGPTLYQAWRRTRGRELGSQDAAGDGDLVIGAIDASSDHAVFLQHLGRPVVSLTYAGQYGVYHSIYDDRYYMEHFGDPGFAYSTNVAQLWGVLAMRLAGAQVLPFDFVPYAELIGAALGELAEAAGRDSGLDFTEVTARVAQFRAAAEHARRAAALVSSAAGGGAAAAALDRAALAVEGNWRSDRVVPGRPWSRHLIYGMRLSFHPQLLPGLTDAIIRRDWPAASDQLAQIAAALDRNATLLRTAARSAAASAD